LDEAQRLGSSVENSGLELEKIMTGMMLPERSRMCGNRSNPDSMRSRIGKPAFRIVGADEDEGAAVTRKLADLNDDVKEAIIVKR
jgi:hypothetical protein